MKAKLPMPTSVSSASEWPDTSASSSECLGEKFSENSSENSSEKFSENSSALIWPDLLNLGKNPERLAWKPFRPGVEIHYLYGDGQQGSAAALLKYAPGAKVPKHEHTGYEHIIVLAGGQRDHQGHHQAGTLVINPPGTQHDVVSDEGCLVLIIWEKPVQIKDP